jgi:hypothetical protein
VRGSGFGIISHTAGSVPANSAFAETHLLKERKQRKVPIAGRSKEWFPGIPVCFFASTYSRFALSSVWRLSGFPDDGPFEEQT